MNTERFYKLGEVQKLLGISRATLWRWTSERGLKTVRVGDVVRIKESDLQTFLKRHESSRELVAETQGGNCESSPCVH